MTEPLSAIASKGVEAISEALKETAITSLKESSPLEASIEAIKNSSIERLKALNANQLTEAKHIDQFEVRVRSGNECKGLTEDEKAQIMNETSWSKEVVDDIGSMKEYEVYKNIDLQESEINGKKCLTRSDIEWEQKDSMGRTNSERAGAGLSPINKDGEIIELHHIGQKSDGALAELTPEEHRGRDNYSILHDTQKESEINRVEFTRERSDYWNARAKTGVQNA